MVRWGCWVAWVMSKQRLGVSLLPCGQQLPSPDSRAWAALADPSADTGTHILTAGLIILTDKPAFTYLPCREEDPHGESPSRDTSSIMCHSNCPGLAFLSMGRWEDGRPHAFSRINPSLLVFSFLSKAYSSSLSLWTLSQTLIDDRWRLLGCSFYDKCETRYKCLMSLALIKPENWNLILLYFIFFEED